MSDFQISRASLWSRWQLMARIGVSMMFYDKLKMLGTLCGVVFAVILADQQAGVFLGLVYKNTMFVDNSQADIWIVPPGTKSLVAGSPLSDAVLNQARSTAGVAWAEPILYGTGNVSLPTGGSEAVTLIGAKLPRLAGGPWNMVAGSSAVLERPDTLVFEDSQRDKLGGMNLGSVRELNGHKVVAGGFTWGLSAFAPPYAFANYETAQNILSTQPDQHTFILAGIDKDASLETVKNLLSTELTEALVYTKNEFSTAIQKELAFNSSLGISFGTSTSFGLIIGLVIVSLSMFSAVIDSIREFGTLKAIGATTLDLAKILITQALAYGLLGSLIGVALVSRMAEGIRSPDLALVLPPVLILGTVVVMLFICVAASTLALVRIRNVEPGMVFR